MRWMCLQTVACMIDQDMSKSTDEHLQLLHDGLHSHKVVS